MELGVPSYNSNIRLFQELDRIAYHFLEQQHVLFEFFIANQMALCFETSKVFVEATGCIADESQNTGFERLPSWICQATEKCRPILLAGSKIRHH